ncbi:MAG: 5-formyltetrahydrofolate cyclo-ligase [Sporomusaceae bacterium]|jgi:5-formyltetrahydrofolate cyclo-ligase|nr:5-formyltetrahydrofolate cyclo-ligase [Sporomusaceae bacterium]
MIEVNKEKKNELRQRVVAERRAKSKEERQAGSDRVAEHLIDWPVYKQAKAVMTYLFMPDEPDMEKVISHALANGKTVCVPHMYETYGQMDAAIIENLDDLVRGKFNLVVPNPATLKVKKAEELDLIIVPGAAYDRVGHRLGMGGGYYDRFLPRAVNAQFIGAVWDCHILDDIPVDGHDKLVNYLVSEKGIFNCQEGKM